MKNILPGRRNPFSGSRETAQEPPCAMDCGSCKKNGVCRIRAVQVLRAAGRFAEEAGTKDGAELSAAEMGRMLSILDTVKPLQAAAEGYSLDELLAGREIPGWKSVAGSSNRRFTDAEAALAALAAAGVAEHTLYERKPLSPAQVEKLVGKAVFSRYAGAYVVKPAGKPKLVPESDRRSPYRYLPS